MKTFCTIMMFFWPLCALWICFYVNFVLITSSFVAWWGFPLLMTELGVSALLELAFITVSDPLV